MGLFKGKKSKEKNHGGCCDMEIIEEPEVDKAGRDTGATAEPACDCGDCCDRETIEETEANEASGETTTTVEVMGPGCKKCQALYENALEAVKIQGKDIAVKHTTDIEKLALSGIMSTPALLINGKVVSSGKVLKPKDIANLL